MHRCAAGATRGTPTAVNGGPQGAGQPLTGDGGGVRGYLAKLCPRRVLGRPWKRRWFELTHSALMYKVRFIHLHHTTRDDKDKCNMQSTYE